MALTDLELQTETLEDGYPEWHPAPYSFHGMLKLFLYREVTGDSYRALTCHPELAEIFGLDRIPGESVLSRTWRNRFDDDVREYIIASAHCLVKEIYNEDLSVSEVRPLKEVMKSSKEPPDSPEDTHEFSDEDIYRTTRLAREYGFSPFNSERAQNATYEDTRFFELQTFIGMVGCGTPQGAARFKFRRGKEYSPHGDTHLRAVKQFSQENLISGFQQATEQLLSVIQSESSFRRPVTVAIDITTIRYFGNVEGMSMVSGTKDGEGRAFKFATLSIVGRNIPLILAVEPVRESSSWDQNPPNQIHYTVRRLLLRAKEHVPIEMVLCDREFDSKAVYQTLSNLDVNYLIPKRIHSR
nr:transposase [Saliphagus sp. LR7]